MEQAKPLSLATKLAMITAAIKRVPKSGRNEFHKYDFATDADIFDAVRELCGQYNVWIQFSMVPGTSKYEFFEVAGKPRIRTTFEGVVKIHDGDSEKVFESHWPSYSHDTDDKGVNKASTSFAKYATIRLFHISTGQDPDASSNGEDSGAKHDGKRRASAADDGPAATGADELERRALVRGIYQMLDLPKKTTGEHHAYAMEQVAHALQQPKVPVRWSEFALRDLRRFVAGETGAAAA